VFHEPVDRALRSRIGRKPSGRGMRCERREQDDAAALPRIGSNCWTRKNGARTLTAKSLSKSSTVVSSIVAAFEILALATRNIQPVADHGADLLGELVRPVRRRKISGDGVSTSAGLADLDVPGVG